MRRASTGQNCCWSRRSYWHYYAAVDEAHRDCTVRYRQLATDLWCAARTQHESVAAIRDVWRGREGARRGIRSSRTDEDQPSSDVAAARRLEDAGRRQFTITTVKPAGTSTG